MTSRTLPRLQLLAAAALFSTGGAAIKATTLTGWQVASLRSAIAAPAVLLLVPAARRGWSWRTLLVGIPYALTMILFVAANKRTTSANAIFLQSAAPLYVLLLGPWLLKERIRAADLAFMAALAAGLALFFIGAESAQATAPDPATGNLLAILSGVFWAFTIVGLRWLGSRGGGGGEGLATVVAGNLIACVVLLPVALPVQGATTTDWVALAYLGIVQIGIAYVCLTMGLRGVPALEASTLLLAEPALNPVWAWLVHGEVPGTWALAGGAVILAATVARTLAGTRDGPAAAAPEPVPPSPD